MLRFIDLKGFADQNTVYQLFPSSMVVYRQFCYTCNYCRMCLYVCDILFSEVRSGNNCDYQLYVQIYIYIGLQNKCDHQFYAKVYIYIGLQGIGPTQFGNKCITIFGN